MSSDLIDYILSYKNLVHAVAGATGSTFAFTTFYPLDTARTRLQLDDNFPNKNSLSVIKHIYEEEGLQGVYRGWRPVVISLCCSNFVYFYAYNVFKVLATRQRPLSPLKNLSLAFAAGVVNVLVTTPLWVVNTRLKLQGAKIEARKHLHQHYDGILDALHQIYHKDGLLSLWSGTLPSLVLVLNPAIHFMVYETLKAYVAKKKNIQELSSLSYFIIGAIAKACATITTYPMQVIQSRLRAGQLKQDKQYVSLLKQFTLIIRYCRSLSLGDYYKGLEAKLLQTILMAALMFLTYEKITYGVFRLMGVEK